MNKEGMSNLRIATYTNLEQLDVFLDMGGQVFPEEGYVLTVRGSRGITNGWRVHGGYLHVGLRTTADGRQPKAYVHRLVWTYVHRELLTSAYTIDHINGDKMDNRAVNLEMVTHSENTRRARERKARAAGLVLA